MLPLVHLFDVDDESDLFLDLLSLADEFVDAILEHIDVLVVLLLLLPLHMLHDVDMLPVSLDALADLDDLGFVWCSSHC